MTDSTGTFHPIPPGYSAFYLDAAQPGPARVRELPVIGVLASADDDPPGVIYDAAVLSSAGVVVPADDSTLLPLFPIGVYPTGTDVGVVDPAQLAAVHREVDERRRRATSTVTP